MSAATSSNAVSSSQCTSSTLSAALPDTQKIYTCDYEVYGKVQGVYFLKHAEKNAKRLGILGWIIHTPSGTVKGQLEGSLASVSDMKTWLQTKGSPKARIDGAVFSDFKEIPKLSFRTFIVIREQVNKRKKK